MRMCLIAGIIILLIVIIVPAGMKPNTRSGNIFANFPHSCRDPPLSSRLE